MDTEQYDLQWQSKNGLHSIWTNKITNSVTVLIDNLYTEQPIKYSHSGRIAYDNPYRVPRYVKEQVYRVYNKLELLDL